MPLKDPERYRAYQREYQREYARRNREKISARRRELWHANGDENRKRLRDRCREARKKNPEPHRAFTRAWYANNTERASEMAKTRWRNNPALREKHRDRVLSSTYGLSLEDYKNMLAAQGGVCAVCKCSQHVKGRLLPLSVDHCHKTGYVRELLCSNCNTAFGQMRDDPELLLAGAEYLRRHADRIKKAIDNGED